MLPLPRGSGGEQPPDVNTRDIHPRDGYADASANDRMITTARTDGNRHERTGTDAVNDEKNAAGSDSRRRLGFGVD